MNVVCVLKSNGSSIYDANWVYKLKRAVERNLSIPFRFVCFSDTELDCDFIQLKNNINGWWNKIQLFNPDFFLGETLYLDLDVVITRPLDSLITNLRSSSGNFFMCKEPTGIANSSIMYWKKPMPDLYFRYIQNSNYYHELYKKAPLIGDQAFISNNCEHDFIENFLENKYLAWTDAKSLNSTENTGLIVFTSIKSKPSKRIFVNNPIIKNNWI